MFAETSAQIQARETIETYRSEIAFAETPEEFADVSERLAKESPAIRASLKGDLKKRMEETKITYNKESKQYEKGN